MSIRSAMLDIFMDPSVMTTSGQRSVMQIIEEALKSYSLQKMQEFSLHHCSFAIFGRNDDCVTCIAKTYKSGLITLSVEGNQDSAIFNDVKFEEFRKALQQSLECQIEKDTFNPRFFVRIPPLKRGTRVPLYLTSSDERILEYDFDKVVFDVTSPYQRVQILHSPTLGNCLILDDLQNLGECDLSYTRGLMKYGELSYTNKEILILGGGDGGLLHELLKEKPKFVTLVDIDKIVIDACRQHLRGACGDALDQLKGENYEVIINDCIQVMKEYQKSGKTFDYVFNDLTDIPIATSPQGELWEFVRTIVILALPLLRPSGRYLNHAIGDVCIEALSKYEDLLKNLPYKVQFKHHVAYVPSFMENWVFYEVWKVS